MTDTKLAFLGAGNIAQAIIGGLLETGFEPGSIIAADPAGPRLDRLAARGVRITNDNTEAAAFADVVVLSVKPDMVASVCRQIAPQLDGQLIVSVAAGITTDSIAASLGEGRAIVRCMPNTPALVRCGMTGLFANDRVSADQHREAESIVGAVGEFIWFEDESDLDAVTAVSGSGPAYFFYVMEAMEQAARSLGLPDDTARTLVTRTALGAATMAIGGDESAGELRRRVTSKGGTTEAALAELEAGNLFDIFARAIKAAQKRSVTLSRS